MKNKLFALLALGFISIINHPLLTARAQGTAFTYQGRLNEGGNSANGSYIFRFTILNGPNGSPVGSPATTDPTTVSNGLFTVNLDFGAGVFTGPARWLFIEVRTNGNSVIFDPLLPVQPLLPAPYAIYAGGVEAAGISGTIPAGNVSGSYSNAISLTNANNVFAGNGTGVTNVNAAQLSGLSAANFWQTGGNAGTAAGVNFLGTTDNQPLELKVNGGRALRLEPTLADADHIGFINMVGGSSANVVGLGVYGASIAGGGAASYFGNYYTNRVDANFGSVGGGGGNTIQTSARFSTIAGGGYNSIQTNAYYSTIGGGYINAIQTNAGNSTIGGGLANTIQTNATGSTIGGGVGNIVGFNADGSTIVGGYDNTIQNNASVATIGGGVGNAIQTNADHSTIGGGYQNTIRADAHGSTIGGGGDNIIQANATYATIPGGDHNSATNRAFAAGTRAKANHTGAFVWADSTDTDFASTTTNQFAVRAENGVMIQGTNNVLDLRGDGAIRVAGAGVGSHGPVFIHRATLANTSAHFTTIDHPLADGDSNAVLLVTHNFSADTALSPYELNAVGVWYDGAHWVIYHENTGIPMPVGRAFNVMIIKP